MTKRKNKPVEPCLVPQLVLTLDVRRDLNPLLFRQIIQTKSFACLILYDSQISQGDESFLQKGAQLYIDDVQQSGAAFLIADESRVVGRVKADGLHVEEDSNLLKSLQNHKKEQKIIGCGNLKSRHAAMNVAETGVDYLMFGKLGADKKPQAHGRNIQLAQWWTEMMEIPAIIQAGADPEFFDETLETACEFIAIEEMIFSHDHPLNVLDRVKEKCKNFPVSSEKSY
ncbi:thiamine phosphate synthase [Bartonella sp. F02]|uniref:thiamine phosphate synthase n=1 Tax=Bartonella sp. F02 TaxID=2967262 RepID=UPI0022A942D6|nr:thiamine phosphate synthase [Bartonella sp. F02]MCZ2328829.1 thiamine phosphate synthase [Bartonella sp. F02]